MKIHKLLSLILILVGVMILGIPSEKVSASFCEQFQDIGQSANDQQAAITPVPTDSTSITVIETPASRVLPPVGSNAGLVIGASVLVLIIIGAVLGSQRKQNH